MADLTSGLFGIQEVRLHDGAVRVVTRAALLEHRNLMAMDLGESGALMAVETTSLKNKTSATIQTVALSTLHAGHGRMLAKRLKAGGRSFADKELHLSLTTVPRQKQCMQAWCRFKRGVKYVGERLVGLKRDTIQLECPARSGGDQINLAALKIRMICRSKDLSGIIIRGSHHATKHLPKKQSDRSDHDRPFQNQSLRLSWISLGEPTVEEISPAAALPIVAFGRSN